MNKRAISFILIITLAITFIGVNPMIFKSNVVLAEEYRNGYSLTPQTGDKAGVDTKSSFLFKSEKQISLEEIEKNLKVLPEINFQVKKDSGGFIIAPMEELKKNQVYQFTFYDATWSYQTATNFSLLGTLPDPDSANVPIQTGIELYFSHVGANVKDYFHIEPSVKGKFEANGPTIVFVPTELKEKTIYTVTLKAGLSLAGSDQKLSDDYTFSFETASKEDSGYVEQKGYFNFNSMMNEIGRDEAPKLPMNYYIQDENTKSPMKINVYAYSSIDNFAGAFKDYFKLPHWSYYSIQNEKIKTEGLTKVLSFEQNINANQNYQQYLDFPQSLNAGYYIVDCTWEDISFQTFMQVTNLSYYYTESSTKEILWINDIETKKPVENPIVTNIETNKRYTGNKDGIVELNGRDDDLLKLYKITAKDQSALVSHYNYHSYGFYGQNSNYWRYLQSDRTLYQPDDEVRLWGFLKNRYENEKINEIQLEIKNSSYYFYRMLPYFGDEMPLISQKVQVKDGFFEGKFELPNLEEGSYQVEVKHGDEVLTSQYIRVENYVKPEYKIEIETDKKAVFAGETIHFLVKTKFFEGTPAAHLDLNYNISGIDYKESTAKTNQKGESEIRYTANDVSGYQGQQNIYFNTYANLPESGQISNNKMVQLFMNDIHFNFETTLNKEKGKIIAQVNKIDLSTLNDHIENNDDFIGEAVKGKEITGTVYKNEWKKKEIGEYYDYINKVVEKQYEYYTEKTFYQNISLKTNDTGKAELDLTFEDLKDCYYTLEVNTTDLSGKSMKFEQYFGDFWRFNPYNNSEYRLESEKETFDLDEKITVQFMKGEELVKNGNFLYLIAQNGIRKYEVKNSPSYTTVFDQTFIPNAAIRGVYFNGSTYIEAHDFSPRLDIEKNKIEFKASMDQESYLPGETVKIVIEASIYSKEKNTFVAAKDVMMNISIVDEALLKLEDQSVDVLGNLYEWVSSGITFSYASHKNTGGNLITGRGGAESEMAYDSAALNGAPMESKAMDEGLTNANIRSEFKDTAYFASLALDENGKGSFEFQLPDNVTAWRITLAGISKSLMAGTNQQELRVTLPYFINTSLNTTYLVGDKPSIGVTSYGNDLKEGEKIYYEVSSKSNGFKGTAEGLAFERINIPLFEMKEGEYDLVIKGVSESGNTDAIEKTISAVKTYREKEIAQYYDLSKEIKITTNQEGFTKLIFTDKGKGKFLPMLYNLAYSYGKRIDQKYITYEAIEILKQIYGENFEGSFHSIEEVKVSEYQNEDGGLGILPYGPSDLETTVKMLALIKDHNNQIRIKSYLYNSLYNGTNSDKIKAVYGLAILDEPIILELDKLEPIVNLSMKDRIYLALSYAEIGDEFKALEIYQKYISKHVERFEERARVKSGKDKNEYLENTALTMILASKIDLDEKELLYDYVENTYSNKILTNSEKLTFILDELKLIKTEELEFSYTYDGQSYNKKLENGWPITIKVPSNKLKDFKITKVSGDGSVIAVYRDQWAKELENDKTLHGTRNYYNYYTNQESKVFGQSDIVKVEINWDIDASSIDDSYLLTDYVPSGLKPIDNVWEMGLKSEDGYWYRDIDGQKVSFYIYKSTEKKKPLYYYARVITPGTYQAEGILIQGNTVRDSISVGTRDTITIQ